MPCFKIISIPGEVSFSNQWVPSAKFNSIGRFVDAKGRAAKLDCNGHLYRIIEKRERTFSIQERIGRFFLGTLAVVCTLFVCPFSKSVRKSVRRLFTKEKETVRFGVLVPESSQKPKYVAPSLPLDLVAYQKVGEAMSQNGVKVNVDITDKIGKHSETLLEVLGKGGSKKAIEISGGRALILPNMDVDYFVHIAKRWERMVLEEVKMSNILNELGLLSPLSEQVSVIVESSHVIPAYISETFANLSLKGCFVIDKKNEHSSTWKQGEHFLFQSDEERSNEKNWDSVFDSLLNDVAKICFHHIPVGIDSLNIAVVKKSSDSIICQYQVRYFGFDFSSKHKPLAIPDVKNSFSTPPNMDVIKGLLDDIVDTIFWCEFGSRYERSNESVDLRKLKDRLVQKYSKAVAERMQPLIKPMLSPLRTEFFGIT